MPLKIRAMKKLLVDTKMINKSKVRKNTKILNNQNNNAATNKNGGATPFLLMIPAAIVFFLFMIVPLLTLVKGSISEFGSVNNPFYKVVTDQDWWNSVIFSFTYAVLTLIASLSISLLISSALASMIRKRFRGFWQTLFFIPYVTSIVAISVVFAAIFDQTGGIFNKLFGITKPWLYTKPTEGVLTLITVWIFGVWQSMAFQILILVTAMLAMDKRLYDAADIDGVSKSRQFFKLTLPQMKTVVNYLILIGLINSLKTFTMALYDNNKDTAIQFAPTMLLYIYRYTTSAGYVDMAGAASVLMIVFIILFQIFVTQGLRLIGVLYNKSTNMINNKKIKKYQDNIFIENLTNEVQLRGLKNVE